MRSAAGKLSVGGGFRWVIFIGVSLSFAALAANSATQNADFPRALTEYPNPSDISVWDTLKSRARQEPFNLAATGIFLLAIVHTFMAPMFSRWSREVQNRHREYLKTRGPDISHRQEVSFSAELLHFLGEVEAIFGIWVIPLMIVLSSSKGWVAARDYLGHGLNFTEPMFVVVIMTIAASRPVLRLAEQIMGSFAALGRNTAGARWFSILTIGPVLGSFITEPAAMTICALLLASQFYERKPSLTFGYATLGLLFVNVSVGGTLTSFAAPPVLMVAGKWGWGFRFMLTNFGWKALSAILVSNLVYWLWFRKELKHLGADPVPGSASSVGPSEAQDRVPVWVTAVHVMFLVWTVINAHFPALFIGGFLFYLAFLQATEQHQNELALRPALLVGFFLAGLVVHGGLQGWWIGPLLGRLDEIPLLLGASGLTAFNDNAAITYLASQVPGLQPSLQYAVVAGAVAGGGLTVIANAPNPAGQSILSRFFPEGVSAARLFLGALIPTAIVITAFLVLK